MSDHRFARRFPLGHPRNAMAPVSREGWMVVFSFVAAMAAGGIAFIALAVSGSFLPGLGIFILLAALAGAGSIILARRKGDTSRTLADYRNVIPGSGT
ncbi:MAG TPA: hypothetical protein VFK86_07390 [Bauldia sp.]|nr:hypothetical protein [Bauldia sp.]